MSNTDAVLPEQESINSISLQEQSPEKMNVDDDSNSDFSTSVDIEADDDDNTINNSIDDTADDRTCRKTSYPHIFQLYMFSSNLFSPGSFSISSSNKFYWERITEAHNISTDKLNAEIKELNRCVLWYMFLPKLLWIIPWICLPIGVVIYAVEDGYQHNHSNASQHELNYHLSWSYNGLFIFVGGGIGGVLLATQLWNHCWYLCIQTMAKKINALNNNELWLNKYCVTFDIQCDIPVLAGRSYGRAYYKIVITIHHDYLVNNNNNNNNINTPKITNMNANKGKSEPMIISLKQPLSFDETMSTAVSIDNTNANNNNNNANMDLFQSLHTSILRRTESQQLNMSLGMGLQNPTEVPRTMSVTMGHITNTQQTKMNYVRPAVTPHAQIHNNNNNKNNERKEEKKEEILIKHELEINENENMNEENIKSKKKKRKQSHKRHKKNKEITTSSSAHLERATLKRDGIATNSLFNLGGFVSKSILNDKTTRSILRDANNDKTNKKINKKKTNTNDSILSNNTND